MIDLNKIMHTICNCFGFRKYREMAELRTDVENLKARVDELATKLEYLEQQLNRERESDAVCAGRNKPSRQTDRKETAKSNSSAGKKKTVTLYANISIVNGNLVINHRSIDKSPAEKMFQINFSEGADQGTYTVNPTCAENMLRDLNTLREFVDFEKPSKNPVAFITIAPGEIRKNGLDWTVKKKLQINFKY